ncbi:uncharacterized protein F4822DRAFT_393921 [Hypoxylon trugodes]|uniref:uncharacterized protein n=1 Tax=Hypoxylon trugodes TaxID=326681 RepID=UPI0021934E54|nr:uncharacterized protein F4822DRAFT_393921 [Hypoxylon trugodes]KAI1390651.1 hypothetical protein F4822DRAFT_393921 [Hypoxylon trugodes]
MPGGLATSRWAGASSNPYRIHKPRGRRQQSLLSSSAPAALSPSQPDKLLSLDQSSPEREFSRFLKIVARLNWKLPFLKQGYSLAKDSDGKDPALVQGYEIQFKLDFHEFYMLIERALVRLMAIYGIVVKGTSIVVNGNIRAKPESDNDASSENENLPLHWYHSNVLAALDDPRNPLKQLFEVSGAREQLKRAKDLRNRWKNLDEAEPRKYPPPPLSTYNLDYIVTTILSAIEQAHERALEHFHGNGSELSNSIGASEGDEWEFITEAMDWEAV